MSPAEEGNSIEIVTTATINREDLGSLRTLPHTIAHPAVTIPFNIATPLIVGPVSKNNKKVELTHVPSGVVINTAAPKDNNGDGSSFSPTDLFSASIGACMMTVMAITAEQSGFDLSGMNLELKKHMIADPRRVERVEILLHLPIGLSDEQRKLLQETGPACPVCFSFHPDIEVELNIGYDI